MFANQNHLQKHSSGAVGSCINMIANDLIREDCSVFATLNSYNPAKDAMLRTLRSLWRADCIMVDIDADVELVGREEELYRVLSWLWVIDKRLPEPNLVSFSGGGGIHLYFAFGHIPASMHKSLRYLKQLINKRIQEYLDTCGIVPTTHKENGTFAHYRVDMKTVDPQRYDRVPGSINPKTGRRCVCFKTGVERYNYQDIFTYFDEQIEINRAKMADYKEKAKLYSRTNKEKSCKVKKGKKYGVSTKNRVPNRRVQGLFALQKNGKSFDGCREFACHIIASSMRSMNKPVEEIETALNTFNAGFTMPLASCELQAILRQKNIYRFTNKYISDVLELTADEKKLMFAAKRPGNRKERTWNNKVAIAKAAMQGMTVVQTAERVGLSVSCVKHMRAAMLREGGFLFWSLNCSKKAFEKEIKRLVAELRQAALLIKNSPVRAGLSRAAQNSDAHLESLLKQGLLTLRAVGSFCQVYNILRRHNSPNTLQHYIAIHPKICASVLDAFCQPFAVSAQLSDSGAFVDSSTKGCLKLFSNATDVTSESAAYGLNRAA